VAYTKTVWVDRAVAFFNRFTKSAETSTSVTLTQDPGTVTQAGTPTNATNLNHMEQGIFDAAATADAAVPKAGGTMTGPLNVPAITLAGSVVPTQRDNAGVFEIFTGGAWKPVGGVKSVQRGTATIAAAAATVAVTITAVNLSKSFLNFSSSNDTGTTSDSFTCRGSLSATTTLSFNRTGTAGIQTIEWEVIESY
jgi:hypothetical protein